MTALDALPAFEVAPLRALYRAGRPPGHEIPVQVLAWGPPDGSLWNVRALAIALGDAPGGVRRGSVFWVDAQELDFEPPADWQPIWARP